MPREFRSSLLCMPFGGARRVACRIACGCEALPWRRAGPIGNALIACPYFRLPDDLVVSRLSGKRGSLPAGTFRGCTNLKSLSLLGNLAALSSIVRARQSNQ